MSPIFSVIKRLTTMGALVLGMSVVQRQTHAASFIVTNTGDTSSTCTASSCSLREAITAANATTTADTITFALGLSGTITLGGNEIPITQDLTIQGPGRNQITVSGNNASRVFNISGGTNSISGLTITRGNSLNATNKEGAGILIGSNVTLALSNCTVSNNVGTSSGAILNIGTATLDDCTFTGNVGRSNHGFGNYLGSGGAINNVGVITLSNCSLLNNAGGQFGGGLSNSLRATLINCTVAGNSVGPAGGGGAGGGLFNWGALWLTNCTISGNSVNETFNGNGGGIENAGPNMTVSNCTITGNTAFQFGGGIHSYYGSNPPPPPSINNTIIAGNNSRSAPDISGQFTSEGFNLIGKSDGSSSFINGTNSDLVGTIATPLDPKLGPLANYGGPAQSHSLLPGSPAIDAGNSPLATDARGFNRPVDVPGAPNASGGNGSDIGAFELNEGVQSGADFVVNQTDDHNDGVCGPTDCTLREAINAAESNADPSAITFDSTVFNSPRKTITIHGQLKQITTDLSISAGAMGVIVSGSSPTASFSTGLFATDVGHLTLSGLTIQSNFSGVHAPGGSITLNRCTFLGLPGNSAGIFTGGGTITAQNCTITVIGGSGNAGILNLGGTITAQNCTIIGNGAGIDNRFGIVNLSNSIVAGNSGGNIIGTINDLGFNVSNDNGNGQLTASTDKIASDLKLGPLADNGGLVQTFALLPGSPAIDAGNSLLSTDARGKARPSGSAPDVGAFEFQNTPPVVGDVTITPQHPKTNDVLSFTANISDPEGAPVTPTYVWKKNGATLEGETGATLDLSVAGNGDKGDSISVVVSASDGTTSTSSESSVVTIVNSAPSILKAEVATGGVSPFQPKTLDRLHGAYDVKDADGDALTLSFGWKKNGQQLSVPDEPGLSLGVAGNGDRGDQITFVVSATDGTDASSLESSPVTIVNSAPSPFSVRFEAGPAFTNSLLRSTVTTNNGLVDDYDNDALITSRVWKKNGVVIEGETGETLDLAKAGNGDKGDIITLVVKRDDGHGGTATAQSQIGVADSLAIPTSVALSPSSPITSDVLQAIVQGSSDADGDAVVYSYQWLKNGTPINAEEGPTLNLSKTGNGDKGDIITVKVSPIGNFTPSTTATSTIINSAPNLAAATYAGNENRAIAAQLLGQDADKELLSYSLVSNVRFGTLTLASNGFFTYTPRSNWNGSDSFQARVRDGSGSTATATFTLSIRAANGVPVAVDDVAKGVEDVPLSIPASALLRNDSNGENPGEVDVLQIIRVSVPAGFPGTLRLDVAKQTLLFTPKLNWNGTTSFSYTVQDSGRATATAQVTLNMVPVNDAPTAFTGRMTVLSGTLGELVLGGSDVEGDALVFALSGKPTNGGARVVKVGNKWVVQYQSKVGFVGTDTLSIIARDGKLNSAPAMITVTVKPNSAPLLVSLTPNKGSFPSGSTLTFEQKVRDLNGTTNLDATALLIGNLPTAANARGGAALWFDATLNRFTLTKDDGVTTVAPVALGQVLENSQVKVTLGAGDVARDNYGFLTLKWRLTFKPAFTGTKSLWMRVEDLGGLSAGFTKSGDVTLAPAAKSALPSPSAATS